MKRVLIKKYFIFILIFGLIFLIGSEFVSSERGRPIIVNNNLVADNGWLLRGENPRSHSVDRNDQSYWDKLRDQFNMNAVRILIYREPQNWGNCAMDCDKYLDCTLDPNHQNGCGNYCQCPGYYQRCEPGSTYNPDCPSSQFTKDASASDFDKNPVDGQLTGSELTQYNNFLDTMIIPYLDDWVNMAADNGFYVIIDYHPVGGNNKLDARLFWQRIAPRYKDRTHVIYELMNEPSLGFTDNYKNWNNPGLVDFEIELFNQVRSLAPNTHIILWSFAHVQNYAEANVQSAPSIDYSYASVGFHIYGLYEDQLDSIRNDYPVMQTEIGGYDTNEYNRGIKQMEDRSLSWITLDGTKKIPPITVTWDKDPYFTGSLQTCSEGQITSTCLCGGVEYSSGYCCSGIWQSSACSTPQTNIVAHWKFDETSGTIAQDSSVNNNDGTLVNGPTWTTGKIGNALSFDGVNDYVSIADSDSLDLSGQFTLSLWYKPRSNIGVQSIFGKNNGNIYSENSYGLMQSSSWLYFKVDDINNGNLAPNWGPLSNGEWYHLAGVFDGSSATVYVDGQSKASKTNSSFGSVRITSQPVYIGSLLSSWSLNGTIDDVRVYNYALSASEILGIFNSATSLCGLSDTSGNGIIEIGELINYIGEWKAGNVLIGELINAIGKWKSGC